MGGVTGGPDMQWLFSVARANGQSDLVVSYGSTTSAQLAVGFEEAAARLAGTAKGAPLDDIVLMPYLLLMRQSYELELKSAINEFAGVYRRHFDGNTEEWARTAVEARLKNELGHRLLQLYREMERIWNLLDLPERPLPDIAKTVDMFHQLDPHGVALRYAARIHKTQQSISFRDLHSVLADGLSSLRACVDYVVVGCAAVPTVDDLT